MTVTKFTATQKSTFLLEKIIKGLYFDNYEVGDLLPTKANLAQMIDASR